MMPSFFGSLRDAEAEGQRCLECYWCKGRVWWSPDSELTEETRRSGRVFHCWGECGRKESEARKEQVK